MIGNLVRTLVAARHAITTLKNRFYGNLAGKRIIVFINGIHIRLSVRLKIRPSDRSFTLPLVSELYLFCPVITQAGIVRKVQLLMFWHKNIRREQRVVRNAQRLAFSLLFLHPH